MSLIVVLLFIIILVAILGLPTWPYNANWHSGYPIALIVIILIVIIVLFIR